MNFHKTLLVALLAIPAYASAGSLKSISAEHSVTGPGGETYIAAEVDCSGTRDDRVIWKKEAAKEWCAKDVEGFCSRRKISAAQDVCSRAYNRALESADSKPAPVPVAEKSPEPAPKAVPEDSDNSAEKVVEKVAKPQSEDVDHKENMAKQKEQLAIERERLKLEQERLELRRQQVELQKQELEVKRQMEAAKKAEQSKAAQKALVKQAESKPEPAPAVNGESAPKKSVLGM
jgi:hypothetical protein